MAYFNYHAKAKRLILNGNCFACTIFSNYHNIKPAMVLYFNNCKPIPIREYMWQNYFPLLKQLKIEINNPENFPIEQSH